MTTNPETAGVEPVAWLYEFQGGTEMRVLQSRWPGGISVDWTETPLYARQTTPAAIRAETTAQIVAIMRDVIRSFQDCDADELAGQMRIRLDHLTGGGE